MSNINSSNENISEREERVIFLLKRQKLNYLKLSGWCDEVLVRGQNQNSDQCGVHILDNTEKFILRIQ
jgi:hypothetical protein